MPWHEWRAQRTCAEVGVLLAKGPGLTPVSISWGLGLGGSTITGGAALSLLNCRFEMDTSLMVSQCVFSVCMCRPKVDLRRFSSPYTLTQDLS